MNNLARHLIAAALLACLAACGNKGPLVRPSAATAPAPVATPPAGDPTDASPVEQTPPPPAADPATATPPAMPPAGGGNG